MLPLLRPCQSINYQPFPRLVKLVRPSKYCRSNLYSRRLTLERTDSTDNVERSQWNLTGYWQLHSCIDKSLPVQNRVGFGHGFSFTSIVYVLGQYFDIPELQRLFIQTTNEYSEWWIILSHSWMWLLSILIYPLIISWNILHSIVLYIWYINIPLYPV